MKCKLSNLERTTLACFFYYIAERNDHDLFWRRCSFRKEEYCSDHVSDCSNQNELCSQVRNMIGCLSKWNLPYDIISFKFVNERPTRYGSCMLNRSLQYLTASTPRGDPTDFNANQLFPSSCTRCQRQESKRPDQKVATISTLPVSDLHDTYHVQWHIPLGQGSYGTVYHATHRHKGTHFAIKRISKKSTVDDVFQRELLALTHVNSQGGHPNICALHETYQDDKFYYLVFDLLSGGEMFDALVQRGAYSELDASRIFRDVTSAIYFLHGIGLVHGDIKPENLLLSAMRDDALVQIIDFGCAHFLPDVDSHDCDNVDKAHAGGNTIAYSPPEVLQNNNSATIDYSVDVWSLGVILYIMLTGLHPFDLSGTSTDEEIQQRILNRTPPPLYHSPITAHLSSSALYVIERCLRWDPKDRISAFDLLQHPWVQGQTANPNIMQYSDKKLGLFRKYKSKVEAQVFANFFSWSTSKGADSVHKRASLIERAFHSLDAENKGFLSSTDIWKLTQTSTDAIHDKEETQDRIGLAQFHHLISDHMKSRYYPSGYIIYREGDIGNHMYFINSGSVEITTIDGVSSHRSQGDFFGEGEPKISQNRSKESTRALANNYILLHPITNEGALIHANQERSATVRCVTPVHLIEINRQDFEKYTQSSQLSWDIIEQDNERKTNRVKAILRLQKELNEVHLGKGEYFFRSGENADSLYILEKGRAECLVQDKRVFVVRPGDICGEHSLIMGRPRNSSIVCVSDTCVAQKMGAEPFYEMYKSISPISQVSLRRICLRREFQKALVFKTRTDFPSMKDLRTVFDAADKDKIGYLTTDGVRGLLQSFDNSLSEDEIRDIVDSIDLDESGKISFEKFRTMFSLDD